MRGRKLEKTGGRAYYTAYPKRYFTRRTRRLPGQPLDPWTRSFPREYG